MSKEVILTGIRANNDLHIGNYFGALLPIIDMAKKRSDEYEINLFVPDLHSFTTPIDHRKLQAQIMHNLKIFVAAGLPLDNDSIHIYRQSYIPAHSELTWILDCFSSFDELTRLTQFKEKSNELGDEYHSRKVAQRFDDFARMYVRATTQQALINKINSHTDLEDLRKLFIQYVQDLGVRGHLLYTSFNRLGKSNDSRISAGLFNYPVLMAADILLYGAKYVPVGDDQTQHLEFTRDIAERMNNQFGELFMVPEPVKKQHEFFGKDQGLRIKDLADPTKKMSKSDESDRGVIFLGDNPEDAAKKVMSATTDSFNDGIKYDRAERRGVANLIDIYGLLRPGFRDDVLNLDTYKELKDVVASALAEFLKDFQAKLAGVDEAAIMQKLEADEKDMNKIAGETLLKVQKAVGLRP